MKVRLLTNNRTYAVGRQCQVVLRNCDIVLSDFTPLMSHNILNMSDTLTSYEAPTLDSLTPGTTPPPAPSTTTNPDFDLVRYVYFYGLAVILPVGLLCNLLCFAVFLSSRSLRRTTTGHYLTALAVADTIFLTGELFRWLNTFDDHGQIVPGIDFVETVTFWCRSTFFLRYAGKLASAWITVVIAAERFLTVAYPLRVARISTPQTAKIGIICIFIVCSLLGAYPFWTIGLLEKNDGTGTFCGYTDPKSYERWTTAVIRVGSLFLPSGIIFVFTTLILIFLRRAKKSRNQLDSQQQQQNGGGANAVEFQLTVMLIGVAIAFLVLRLPYTISYYINEHMEMWWGPEVDPLLRHRIFVANKVCDMIASCNYAVNFFLYCLCGSKFRARLRDLLQCHRLLRRRGGGGGQERKVSAGSHSSKL